MLTYNLPKSALQDRAVELDMTIQRFANETGEAFLSLFTPEEMEKLLIEHGYGEIKHFGPEEVVRTYFAGRSDVRFGGAQRLISATAR